MKGGKKHRSFIRHATRLLKRQRAEISVFILSVTAIWLGFKLSGEITVPDWLFYSICGFLLFLLIQALWMQHLFKKRRG